METRSDRSPSHDADFELTTSPTVGSQHTEWLFKWESLGYVA